MYLEYKPDWEETKERFKAWWDHEYFGRCAMALYAPKDRPEDVKKPELPEKLEDRWLDFDYLHDLNEYRMSGTSFLCEALPVWNPGYPGWDMLYAYLGSKVTLKEETGWLDPFMEEGELTDYDYRDIRISPDNHWWKFSQKMHRFAASEAKGRSLAGLQALSGCGDVLAGIRGSGKLLTDLMDCPEYVCEFDQHLVGLWAEAYDVLYEIIRPASEGSTCWFNLWSPGKFYAVQNDFAYMISPKMFEDIFMPGIRMHADHLDHAIYHVDGVGNFAHVDAICSVEGIQALQILPGRGRPSPLHYMDILKKVQAAGKNLHIMISADEVKTALDNLSARGLFIHTYTSSAQEAADLLRCVEKWSVDR